VDLNHSQWAILFLGAFITGLSKTGISGFGILSVALFACVIDPKSSTGALLPLLVCADVFGVAFYRKHTNWAHLFRLFPWVVVGLIAGWYALGVLDKLQVQRMIGWILLAMIALHLWRQRRSAEAGDQLPRGWWFAAFVGVLAGFTTMVANAAGPVMIIYLLAVGLPKLEFIGTGAWFFMLVNVCKLPLSASQGLITRSSLLMDALLILPMIPGALLGPVIVKRINQRLFEWLALALTLLAALKLAFL
jgi:uncharacterized membrane protein YfcA